MQIVLLPDEVLQNTGVVRHVVKDYWQSSVETPRADGGESRWPCGIP